MAEEMKAVNFKLPEHLRKKLRIYSINRNISYNALFKDLIVEHLSKSESKPFLKGAA